MQRLSEHERERYRRQILMTHFGEAGQKKLKKAHVFIAGAGGLGSPIALYLAAAGVGKITLVDNDSVALSNLNRQILHWTNDVGRKKVESAHEKLAALNPEIEIETLCETITDETILSLAKGCDAFVDALDNFETRYAVNRAAIAKNVPFFHGAVYGLEGRTTTIIPKKTACFRCVYERAPPKEVFPVVGTTPGVIGAIQATEVIKYFTDIGDLLKNRLLIYDGGDMRFYEIQLKRNQKCEDCR